MKIISFNIRCANVPNGNSVEERSKRLKIILEKYNVDIIGFQETTPEWYEFLLKDYNKEYEIFNRFRDTVNPESSPILWKKERFDCLDKGYFIFYAVGQLINGFIGDRVRPKFLLAIAIILICRMEKAGHIKFVPAEKSNITAYLDVFKLKDFWIYLFISAIGEIIGTSVNFWIPTYMT